MNETLRQVLAELPEIRERAEDATAGPWEHVGLRVYRAETRRYAEDEICVAHIMLDSNFIAHAREDVPKLAVALQAAAEEAEMFKSNYSHLYTNYNELSEECRSLSSENQRLQAEIERLQKLCGDLVVDKHDLKLKDELREPVRWFAEQMESTLKKNDHKGGWEECTYNYLFTRMKEELLEIQGAIFKRNPDFYKIIGECTDVANFALMIADLARKKVEA